MGADGHRFSPNSLSPLLPCLPSFFVSTLPPRLPPAPTAPGPIAGISTVLYLEERGLLCPEILDAKEHAEELPRRLSQKVSSGILIILKTEFVARLVDIE